MNVRKAQEKDAPRLKELLKQVLEVHAKIRPDIFISGSSKYDIDGIIKMIHDPNKAIFVAVDDHDYVLGYGITMFKRAPYSLSMKQFKTLFIDDICVDENLRHSGCGKALFEAIKQYAKESECYDITLNVWEGNQPAKDFYTKMGLFTKETQLEYILNKD